MIITRLPVRAALTTLATTTLLITPCLASEPVLVDPADVQVVEERTHSVPELSTTVLIGIGGLLMIFRKRRQF